MEPTLKTRLLKRALIFALLITSGFATDKEQSKKAALDLEVATFNIRYLNINEKGNNHWSKRKGLVVTTINALGADVIGLQEALKSQLEDIETGLPDGYYTSFGVGRDDGKTRGEYSPILYRSDRYQLDKTESGTFWLSDTPEKVGSKTWGNEIPRICTWARLTDNLSKRSFYIFNTHWDHRSQESRVAASKLIMKRIKNRKHPEEPVVLMGDFNADKTNPAIRHITEQLADSYTIANPDAPDTRTFHGFKGGKQGQKIDHVFVPRGTVVKSASISHFNQDGVYPSDHYPVQARLQFR